MSNLLLDTSGDLDTSNGVKLVTGPDAVKQRLRTAFCFLLGEWFLDTREGVPWYEVILVKGTSEQVISEIFRSVLLRDPEVETIVDFTMDIDRVRRTLKVKFVARLASGVDLVVNSVNPLIIDLSRIL